MSSSSIFCGGILLRSQQSILYEFVNYRAELGHISNYLLRINVLLDNLLHEKTKKNDEIILGSVVDSNNIVALS